MLKIVSITSLFLLCSLNNTLQAAPSVPEILTKNGLTYCTNATGFSFNPQTADAGTSMNTVTEQIYNKLFDIKNHSAKVIPVLASSYNISEDGRVITINLRKGIKFHHTPWFTPTRHFNADDVVFSLNRVLGHDTALPEFDNSENENPTNRQYQVFHELAKKIRFPYFESIKLNEKIEMVEAVNPYQVRITLFTPDSSILSHLASQYAIIFSQEYALQLNADNNLQQLDILPVGTGAYQLKDYVRNQYVRLIRNKDYWKKTAKIKNIIMDLSTDRTGRLAKFFNGECHIVTSPELSQLGLLKHNKEGFQMLSTEGMNLSFLAFNFQKQQMQDVELRRAIAQAINRARIIKDIYYDTATEANHIIPKVSWAASVDMPELAYQYAPEQAKQVLQNKKLNLTMWVINEEQVYNPSPLKMAELIRFDLAQVGVTVNVKSISRNYLIQQIKNKSEDYDIILTGWLAGSLDPDSFMRPILSCNTAHKITNLANWCYPSFDDIMNQALFSEDQFFRANEYKEAQKIILSQLPILPIAHVKRILIAGTHVKGVEMTPFGSINFEKLSLQQKQGGKQ
ncbi:MAG TPA: ABC transporter substrate-binding protein [Pasteurellaceae bacterium]|nr:ABC transporter substrate-binding protein [Pasteurellaceae bacterium]